MAVRTVNHPPAGNTIGVINIEGMIAGSNSANLLGEGSCTATDIMAAIREAAANNNIKAVVLKINSPGGTSAASQEIALELDRLRQKGKPVVTSMGDVCASGGYWVACSTDHIVANGASMTGSIGVIMEVNHMEELYRKLGISHEVIKSGLYKDIGSSSRPLTNKEKELLQAMVDDTYEQFLEQVIQGRQGKMDSALIRKLADGRIFTGRQALKLGMVDSLGNYYDAVQVASRLAGIKGEPTLQTLNPGGFWEQLKLNVNPQSLLQTQNLKTGF